MHARDFYTEALAMTACMGVSSAGPRHLVGRACWADSKGEPSPREHKKALSSKGHEFGHLW